MDEDQGRRMVLRVVEVMTSSLEQTTDPDLLAQSVTANLLEGAHAERELLIGLVRFASWLLHEHEAYTGRSARDMIQLYVRST